jgi:hypothetical protein
MSELIETKVLLEEALKTQLLRKWEEIYTLDEQPIDGDILIPLQDT